MRDNFISQLQSSILLGSLSLIPNHTLRYTILGITAFLALLYVLHLRCPSTQLRQLAAIIEETEDIIRNAKSYCARDLINLSREGVRLLEVKRSASMIQCHMLEMNTLTWKKYRLLSRDITECAKNVKKIRTAVQLIVEAERQRKYTEDITDTEIVLGVRYPGRDGFTYEHDSSYAHQQAFSV